MAGKAFSGQFATAFAKAALANAAVVV